MGRLLPSTLLTSYQSTPPLRGFVSFWRRRNLVVCAPVEVELGKRGRRYACKTISYAKAESTATAHQFHRPCEREQRVSEEQEHFDGEERTWCTADERESISEGQSTFQTRQHTCNPPLHCTQNLISSHSPPIRNERTPPVLQVSGSVDPELKSQSRRPQTLPFQLSTTSNETLVYWFACQPVANEGAVPADVNMAWG